MTIVALVLQCLLIFAFFFSSVSKIAGAKMQVEAFAHLGLPQWFRIATGWIALASTSSEVTTATPASCAALPTAIAIIFDTP